MKKLISLLLLLIYKMPLLAQAPINSWPDEYTYPQINGPVVNGLATPLTTNPRNSNWPSPWYSPDFKINRFPWFSETAPNTNLNPAYEYKMQGYQNMTLTHPQHIPPYNEIISPFSPDNATGYTQPLRFRVPTIEQTITTSPDYLPEDGWELVKQDFGFANYNNTNALVTISPLHISYLNKL